MAKNKSIILDEDQKEVIKYCLKHPYSIMRVDMGGGKTGLSAIIKDLIPNSRCLVILPAGLVLNWPPEIEKFLETPQQITVFKKSADVYYPLDSDFVIISYDLVIKFEYLFEWANIIFIDEGTYLKEMKTKRSQKIHKMIYENSIPRVHILTGTPLINRVSEFYSLIALCNYNPEIGNSEFLEKFPDYVTFADYFSHRKEYDIFKNGKWIKVLKWEGLKNEAELRYWLKDIYISKKSKRPPITWREIQVSEFNEPELLEEFNKFSDIDSTESSVKAASALRKAPLTYSYVSGLLDRGEIQGPAIVFTDHRESAKLLANKFGTIAVTGETTLLKRRKAEIDFQAGMLPVIVATFGVWAKGPNLERSNYIAMNDYPWRPGDIKQAGFRIDRKTQTRRCVVDMILGSPQDIKILREVRKKSEVTDKF